MTSDVKPGLLVLHGNRLEALGDAVFEWVRTNPLQPLEEEIFLVQSNGVAEWLKMAIATRSSICAATRVELPGRFMWRAYRQVLGRDAVPKKSALDKLPLVWRLMNLLPLVAQEKGFEPLAGFLRAGDLDRRLQLAQRLADLYDQYQVYRSDWLAAWAAGQDVLPRSAGEAGRPGATVQPLPADQLWQSALWRELLVPVSLDDRAGSRPHLHQRFLAALEAGSAPATPLARRIVLFGAAQVPMQTLEALAALSQHCQVILAIPNPCRFHWADIIDGRELLLAERRRLPNRQGRDLARVSLEQMHAHANPLLAAWGRQGRDFVRQLDAFDDAMQAQQRFALPKIDLFDEGPGETLLEQVQASIRDLVPLAELPLQKVVTADRSIVFHVAHSAQREVEILHDQLLSLLDQPPAKALLGQLHPRDIIVMVPDIDVFAPAIRSVFGQYPRGDARFIPYGIADLTERGNNPMVVALEWLLRLPQHRCSFSEVRDLLDVPAVSERFGLQAQDLPRLTQWMEGSGIRWGLSQEQRASQGLAACGEQNTWIFGMRRMLMGYATGDRRAVVGSDADKPAGTAEALDGIEPYAEVGGLDAALAGSLGAVVEALTAWWSLSSVQATPFEWAERARALVDEFFAPTDERERLTVKSLQDALRDWLDACSTAGFDDPVNLAVVREAWLSGIDAPGLNRRFRAGGVTFCTLMPMRAIPFEVVCMLGMNDGDYPRRSSRSDFDLMGLPGQKRPGDRSRRDDDRQLMLEALLAARRMLYVSWAGRSVRDNSVQPPSVLVSQLRDYLAAGWRHDGGGGVKGDGDDDCDVLTSRTTEHPLQPFSRRYFEQQDDLPEAGERLFTHAREWRAAHSHSAAASVAVPPPTFEPNPDVPLTVAALSRFLKNPVKDFFRQRLDVFFRDGDTAAQDDEAFALDGLEEYGLLSEVTDQILVELQADAGSNAAGSADLDAGAPEFDLRSLVAEHMARIQRAGRLPMAEFGRRIEVALVDALEPMLAAWQEVQALYPSASAREPLRYPSDAPQIDDWLDGLQAPTGDPTQRVWIEIMPSRLCNSDKLRTVRPDKLVAAWVKSLVASACKVSARGVIIGRDAMVTVNPLPAEAATAALNTLLRTWREGMSEPIPLACKTGLALARGAKDVAGVYEGSQFGGAGKVGGTRGEVEEACLARMYPDFEALSGDGRFQELAQRLFAPIQQWVTDHVTREVYETAKSDEQAEPESTATPTQAKSTTNAKKGTSHV